MLEAIHIEDSVLYAKEIFKEGDWKVMIPIKGLTSGCVQFGVAGRDANWQDLFVAMRKVAQFWEGKGVTHYLYYSGPRDRKWEMVPYEGSEDSMWDTAKAKCRQFLVMSRVISDRVLISEDEQAEMYTEYKGMKDAQYIETTGGGIGSDVFCQDAVIGRQQICEMEHIRVLQDYAPLGDVHILLMPKIHKERFSELSMEEFCQMRDVAEKVIALYPGYLCYRYHKTGTLAGQTVKHFHEHVVLVAPQNEWQDKAVATLRMVGASTALSPEELKAKVAEMQGKLKTQDELGDAL